MPLEISEIGVHVAVGGAGPSGEPRGGAGPGGDGPGPGGGDDGGQALTQAHVDQIVSTCVAQVMRNLRQREER
jgi:hypothetical protein